MEEWDKAAPSNIYPFFVWTESSVLQWAPNMYSSLVDAEYGI